LPGGSTEAEWTRIIDLSAGVPRSLWLCSPALARVDGRLVSLAFGGEVDRAAASWTCRF
jgi:hypothetical protein